MPNFSDLPRELRDMVYDFYFRELLLECRDSGRHCPTILRTSQQIALEAMEVWISFLEMICIGYGLKLTNRWTHR